MADEMYDRIEKQLEGNSLALAAVAEILQKMDYRMSEEEEYLLAKEEEEEAEADREALILDIAHELIRLSGYEPELDIPISFIGARPGEKKIEELTLDSEYIDKTAHDKIMVVNNSLDQNVLSNISRKILDGELDGNEFDKNQIRDRLSKLVPEYKPGKNQADPVILRILPEAQA